MGVGMIERMNENEAEPTPADLTPVVAAEVLRIRIESEIIREDWRERDAPEE